jgi:hypothetical protein
MDSEQQRGSERRSRSSSDDQPVVDRFAFSAGSGGPRSTAKIISYEVNGQEVHGQGISHEGDGQARGQEDHREGDPEKGRALSLTITFEGEENARPRA